LEKTLHIQPNIFNFYTLIWLSTSTCYLS